MKKHSCAGCGITSSRGYLFDNPQLGICGQCRDVFLAYLQLNGYPMNDSQWLVKELCEDSHAVAYSNWRFWSPVMPDTHQVVVRVRK